MESGFARAGFETFRTESPGIGYIISNRMKVRIMEASGPAPLRASFTNHNDGAISPFTRRPVHPPKNLEKKLRKKIIREHTHLELTP